LAAALETPPRGSTASSEETRARRSEEEVSHVALRCDLPDGGIVAGS
jgi:hypothetical protein